MRVLTTTLLVLALGACGSGNERDRDRDRDRSERRDRADDREANRSENSAANSSNGNLSGAAVTPPSDLSAQLEREAATVRPRLPLKQGPVTITAVDVDGNDLVYTVQADQHVERAIFEQSQDAYVAQACENPNMRATLSQGIGFVYRVTDSDGHEFETRPEIPCGRG